MKWLRYFFSEFIPEVIAEMKKVTFPSRDEVMGTTVVVIITSFIFALFLGAADFVIQGVFRRIFDMTSRLLT